MFQFNACTLYARARTRMCTHLSCHILEFGFTYYLTVYCTPVLCVEVLGSTLSPETVVVPC